MSVDIYLEWVGAALVTAVAGGLIFIIILACVTVYREFKDEN